MAGGKNGLHRKTSKRSHRRSSKSSRATGTRTKGSSTTRTARTTESQPRPRKETGEGKLIEGKLITAGEIIAWRCWRLCWWRDRLRSVFIEERWEPQKPLRAASHYLHGIHTWKTRELADLYGSSLPARYAIGQVEIWGNVHEHEWGYRAEYAAVKSIDSLEGFWIWPWTKFLKLRRLRRKYGVS